MPTIISLSLRDGADNHHEDVDLDALTPRARALAEAISQSPLRTRTDIWMEHETPIRDRIPDWQLWYTEEEAALPERRPWRGWSTYPIDSYMTPAEYLEQEARKIPPGWHVLGYSPHTPVPSIKAGAADTGMTRDAVLEYLRQRGRPIAVSTWSAYVARGQAPSPARRIQRTPLWEREDIDAWLTKPA
jgi:hypothetical protein